MSQAFFQCLVTPAYLFILFKLLESSTRLHLPIFGLHIRMIREESDILSRMPRSCHYLQGFPLGLIFISVVPSDLPLGTPTAHILETEWENVLLFTNKTRSKSPFQFGSILPFWMWPACMWSPGSNSYLLRWQEKAISKELLSHRLLTNLPDFTTWCLQLQSYCRVLQYKSSFFFLSPLVAAFRSPDLLSLAHTPLDSTFSSFLTC